MGKRAKRQKEAQVPRHPLLLMRKTRCESPGAILSASVSHL